MVSTFAVVVSLWSTLAFLPQDPPEPPMENPLAGLNFTTGKVTIGTDLAIFDAPAGFTYLQKRDAKLVVEQFWGNMPSDLTLGLIVNGDQDALLEGGWAIIVSFVEEGYVEDDDAKDTDYDELLKSMQADIEQTNEERRKANYETAQLLGWAEPPHYDAATKKLYWAKHLRFSETPGDVLNYDVRILGRRGVLQLRAVGDMEDLAEISAAVKQLLPRIEFNPGHRYEDFDSKLDSVAAYGIGGLIAGKVLAKAGLFAIIGKFAKVIILALVALAAGLRRMFAGKKETPPAAS